MPDVFTKAKRSDVMSRIRGSGNKDTEVALATFFRRHGITGWRRHALLRFQVPGSKFQVKPDFVFPKRKLAVFVDGCFWHGCPKHGTTPEGNAKFWREKLAKNKARDRRVNRELRKAGWRVLRIWEHEIHHRAAEKLLRRLDRALRESTPGRLTD